MDENNILSASDLFLKVANITISPQSQELPSVWKTVVSGIHSYKDENENAEKRMPIGARLAGNTRVVDLKNGVLLVETDHSGWIQYLKFYQQFILKGLKMKLPQLKITSLAFRVTGSNAKLADIYEEQVNRGKQIAEKKYSEEEERLNEFYKNQNLNNSKHANHSQDFEDKKKINTELPPEIQSIFESIKQDMLTNGDK